MKASNEKLLRILRELENPIAESPLTLTFSDDLAKIPTNLEDYQDGPRSSSSIFVEGFNFPSFSGRHRKQTEIDWKKKNVVSTPSAACLLDSTKCYGHREAYDMPRKVTERFETNAVKNLAKTSLRNPRVNKEYLEIKAQMEQGVHPVNLSNKSTYVSSTRVLVKKPEGRYIVDVSDTNADIVGISSRKNNKSMGKFKNLMNKLYDLNLEGY